MRWLGRRTLEERPELVQSGVIHVGLYHGDSRARVYDARGVELEEEAHVRHEVGVGAVQQQLDEERARGLVDELVLLQQSNTLKQPVTRRSIGV